MGVDSLQHMTKLAQELRASMPTQTEHQQAQSSEFGADAARAAAPARSGVSVIARRAPLTGSLRRSTRAGHGESEMLLLEKDYEEVRVRYEELLKQNEALKTDTRRRMESYIRREARYKEEIVSLRDELRRALAGLGGGDDEGVMGPLHAMHGQILTGLTGLQDKTKAVLQEQEADLLRAFRARLYDVQMELEAERSKKDDGALEWIERTRTLGKELDWSREEALRLDRTNQHLAKENGRLRNQAAAQDDDRQFLLRQLVALKKENAALRDTNLQIKAAAAAAANGALRPTATTAETTVEPLTRPGTSASTGALPWRQSASQASRLLPGSGGLAPSASVPHLARPTTTPAQRSRLSVAEPQLSAATAGGGTAVATAAVGKVAQLENRLREATANRAEAERRGATVASRLNKMIDAERRALRALRATHTRELQSRSELEIFLRQCIADVKAQLSESRARSDLSAPERQRVMELLLSQERVVSLLYAKTFPRGPAPQSVWQGDLVLAQSTPPESPTRTDATDSPAPQTGSRFASSPGCASALPSEPQDAS